MLAGLVAGAVLGVAAHLLWPASPVLDGFVGLVTEPVGAIFLRLLFMLVIPLVVSALALGVAGLGGSRRLGRIGLRTLAYTVVVSSIAVSPAWCSSTRAVARLAAAQRAALITRRPSWRRRWPRPPRRRGGISSWSTRSQQTMRAAVEGDMWR
jgi:hypothetical protein